MTRNGKSRKGQFFKRFVSLGIAAIMVVSTTACEPQGAVESESVGSNAPVESSAPGTEGSYLMPATQMRC